MQVFASNTGEVVAYHQLPLKSSYPFAEWVEQDPIEILKIVIECIDETTKKLEAKGFCPSNIVAIGITNQRETTILWDKYTGLPLYKAIGNYNNFINFLQLRKIVYTVNIIVHSLDG